uniref:MYND-type domain-containing protein n=1 Tax=Leptobrachium leishanense TaxID=445787 RepID=A0A8C5MF62_9ANUR
MSEHLKPTSSNESHSQRYLEDENKEPRALQSAGNRDELSSEDRGEDKLETENKEEVQKYIISAWENLNKEDGQEETCTVVTQDTKCTKSSHDERSRGENIKDQSVQEELQESLERQEWSDGSSYRGNMSMDMKLGYGEFRWVNGESYTGEFYKDHLHGEGVYCWPDGTKFTGAFYLSRKEGYGTVAFADGRLFKGLYKSDVRFGPGVETYLDNCQDVGIWRGNHLIKICSTVPGLFSISSYPKFSQRFNEDRSNKQCPSPRLEDNMVVDPFPYRYKMLLLEDSYTLPDRIYLYSTDTDHLPLPPSVRSDFDLQFYRSTKDQLSQINDTTCHTEQFINEMEGISLHINKYRSRPEYLSWNIGSIMCGERENFGPKGPRERFTEQLITKAAEGDYESVYNILRHNLAHVDVSDLNGNNALHAATVNGHNDIINLLLDNGADVNKCSDEGVSALSMCMIIFYSTKSLWPNVAERNFAPAEEEKKKDSVVLRTDEDSWPESIMHENVEDDISASPSNGKDMAESKAIYSQDKPDRPSAGEATMKLLLQRGSDPNKFCYPMPALFLAIKAADVHTVQLLLEHGARTDITLDTPHGRIGPLHIAAALPVVEGVRITEILLHAGADSNVRAGDGDYVYEQDRVEKPNIVPGFFTKCSMDSGISLSNYWNKPSTIPEEGGRTPLHVACERDDNYKAVKELLAKGADPNLPLGRWVGSVLCAAASTTYERRRPLSARIALIDKFIKAGADILMPVLIGAGKKTALGTATDFAYYKYLQDKRIANSPYHALTAEERDIYNERRQLLEYLGNLTQEAVMLREQEWAKDAIVRDTGLPRESESKKKKDWHVGEEGASHPQKAFFKYCCHCGRSLGVKLTACSRCYSVYTCSKQCKKRSWDEFHKDQCQPSTGKLSSKLSAGRSRKAKEKSDGNRSPSGGRMKSAISASGEEQAVLENYSFN